ncbi:MAG TPA: Xaa-Pro peptidase family protein [Mycobacteriales bacterium]|nr:Xaa-Pro peptidase family protein [Mycobacteriales bacterium]
MTSLYAPDRLARARQAAADAGLDALLITPGADLRYLTGYAAMPLERLTCLVLPVAGEPVLVVPRLERPAALVSPVAGLGIEVLGWDETDDPYALVAHLLRAALGRPAASGSAATRIGLANRMWLEQGLRLRDATGAEAVLAGRVLRALRIRKSTAEVAALRRAGQAIDRVHERVGEWLRPGRTEAEVGRDIAEAIVAEGHVRTDFVIVGSGPNGASPHHELSDRVIEAGDPVVVDIGGTTAEGYCSDETRTYVVGGQPPAEFRRYYAVLAEAQAAACAAITPGASCESIDAAARDLITAAGYGEFFVHRTGHGIGLESHEDPYLVAGNAEPLEPGMAFSVEPGIYLPGRHGARIEDICVCTGDGGERLNLVSRDLMVLH